MEGRVTPLQIIWKGRTVPIDSTGRSWEAEDGRHRERLLTWLDLEWQGKGGIEAATGAFEGLEALDKEFHAFVRESYD